MLMSIVLLGLNEMLVLIERREKLVSIMLNAWVD